MVTCAVGGNRHCGRCGGMTTLLSFGRTPRDDPAYCSCRRGWIGGVRVSLLAGALVRRRRVPLAHSPRYGDADIIDPIRESHMTRYNLRWNVALRSSLHNSRSIRLPSSSAPFWSFLASSSCARGGALGCPSLLACVFRLLLFLRLAVLRLAVPSPCCPSPCCPSPLLSFTFAVLHLVVLTFCPHPCLSSPCCPSPCCPFTLLSFALLSFRLVVLHLVVFTCCPFALFLFTFLTHCGGDGSDDGAR